MPATPDKPRFCEQTGCIRKVLPPYIYCDEHSDRSSTPPTTPDDEIQRKLYELMDAFMVESKNQHGQDRSIEQLNRDRHLFIENAMQAIADQRCRDAAAIKAKGPQDRGITKQSEAADYFKSSANRRYNYINDQWRAAVDAVLLNDQGKSE